MVDNSLITSRIEYSTFLNLPLDECIVNTPLNIPQSTTSASTSGSMPLLKRPSKKKQLGRAESGCRDKIDASTAQRYDYETKERKFFTFWPRFHALIVLFS